MTRCGGEDAPPCMAGQRCLTHGLWDALGDRISTFLGSVTLQEVLDGIPTAIRQAASPCACRRTPCGVARGMSAGRTYLDWNATAPLRPEARDGLHRGARCRRQSVIAACGRAARARHHRGCARAGCGAGRRQAGGGGVHQRRHGSQQCRAGRGMGHDRPVRHRARLGARAGPRRQGAHRRDAGGARWRGARRMRRSPPMRSPAGSLLSLQMANNETGVIQPVAEVAAAAKAQGFFVHTDAVQAAGRIPVDLRALGVDCPDAVRPQDRRAEGRRRAGHSRARQPSRLHCRRRAGAAAPRGNRKRGGHRRVRCRGRGGAARSCTHAAALPRCATGWKARCVRSRRRPS